MITKTIYLDEEAAKRLEAFAKVMDCSESGIVTGALTVMPHAVSPPIRCQLLEALENHHTSKGDKQ